MDQAAPYDASELTIDVQSDERGTVVMPRGEIDLANAADFEQGVFEALHDLPARLTVDLSSLSFMDLLGVRALLRCRDQARRYDVPFFLSTGDRGPYRLLALSGVLGEFDRDGAGRDDPDATLACK
jgi:anti-anti-sigma factor